MAQLGGIACGDRMEPRHHSHPVVRVFGDECDRVVSVCVLFHTVGPEREGLVDHLGVLGREGVRSVGQSGEPDLSELQCFV